jgi:hypothetical protein
MLALPAQPSPDGGHAQCGSQRLCYPAQVGGRVIMWLLHEV